MQLTYGFQCMTILDDMYNIFHVYFSSGEDIVAHIVFEIQNSENLYQKLLPVIIHCMNCKIEKGDLREIQPCQLYDSIGEYEKSVFARTYVDMIPIIELDRNIFTENYKLEIQSLCKRVQFCKMCLDDACK